MNESVYYVFKILKDSIGHVFCRECIETWLEYNESCPIDRSPLTIDQLQPMHIGFKSLLSE